MYKTMLCVFFTLLLSSCSLFQIHRQNIEQGNIITEDKVAQLKIGMSEQAVKNVMGTPMLVNVFTPNRVHYIYTMQKGNAPRYQKTITCIFTNHHLSAVLGRTSP